MVDRCTEIIFRLFQEDIADDDWLAEGMFYSKVFKVFKIMTIHWINSNKNLWFFWVKQKTGNIKIADIDARREHSFSLQLDPKGKLHVKINLYKPMDSEG